MLSITNTVRGLFARPATPSRPRPRRRLLRLECLEQRTLLCNPGELDLTFDGDGKVTTDFGGAEDFANDVALQTDGKIVVAGVSNGAGQQVGNFAVARYTASGGLDTTFGGTGLVLTDVTKFKEDQANAVAIQSDGKIIAAGFTTKKQGSQNNQEWALVRYNTNGTLDSSFGSGGKVITNMGAAGELIHEIVIQSNGKIVAVGQSANRAALARYNSNGTLDTSFGSGGKVFTSFYATNSTTPGIVLQTDGRIVMAATLPASAGSESGDWAVTRFNTNGSTDTTFGSGGTVVTPGLGHVEGVALQADGQIVVIGTNAGDGFMSGAARYSSNGVLDTTFGTNGVVLTRVPGASLTMARDVSIQADGKILLTGYADLSLRQIFAFRYTTAGTLDTSFDADGIVTTAIGSASSGHGIVVQPDGNIVVSGSSSIGGFTLVRYCP